METITLKGIAAAPDKFGRFRFLITDEWELRQAIPWSRTQSVPYVIQPDNDTIGVFWVTMHNVSDAQKRLWTAEVEQLRGARVTVTCKKRTFRFQNKMGTALDFIKIEKNQ